MDCRLHLCVDGGGLALCGRRRRSVLPPCGWLVDERRDDGPARHRRPGNGDLATGQAGRAAASFRSRQPIHQRAVPAADGRSRRRLFNEPFRQCLGQCGDGELLLVVEDRAYCAQNLPNERRCQGRRVRLYRTLLQSETPALDDRIFEPYGVRAADWISLSGCQPNRVQLTRAKSRLSFMLNEEKSSCSSGESLLTL